MFAPGGLSVSSSGPASAQVSRLMLEASMANINTPDDRSIGVQLTPQVGLQLGVDGGRLGPPPLSARVPVRAPARVTVSEPAQPGPPPPEPREAPPASVVSWRGAEPGDGATQLALQGSATALPLQHSPGTQHHAQPNVGSGLTGLLPPSKVPHDGRGGAGRYYGIGNAENVLAAGGVLKEVLLEQRANQHSWREELKRALVTAAVERYHDAADRRETVEVIGQLKQTKRAQLGVYLRSHTNLFQPSVQP